ncbi:DUF6328 family protein [Saxibacter everestensis]|uniref:DUF6328 family protein n=1 Tax=Saxibacter everestensis TaxID=2909229 RepID=A0ABY8QRK5_9MICO|nr:DUF6328 family protein [Brevibacteriaceae bacterium ZFBP1038]
MPNAADIAGNSDYGRHETENERLDRNWVEMLQELRVMQTGVQILTGFLLTLPFQASFDRLDSSQRTGYLVLVVLAALVTGLVLTPVSLHRGLFGRGIKSRLVANSDRVVRVSLASVGLLVAGTVALVFDVVVGRTAALVVGGSLIVVLLILWLAFPFFVRRKGSGAERKSDASSREAREHDADESGS